MKTSLLLICTTFILTHVGMAIQLVGEVPKCSIEPYQLWLPLVLFSIMFIPAILGYFAGKS